MTRTPLKTTPSVDLVYQASQNAASPEEAELQRRAEPSGMPHEETVAGEMAVERYDARVTKSEDGSWWTGLAAISKKERR